MISPGFTSRMFVSPSGIHSSNRYLLSPPASGSVTPPCKLNVGIFPFLIASSIGTIVRSSLTTASVNDAVNLTLSGTPYVCTSPAGWKSTFEKFIPTANSSTDANQMETPSSVIKSFPSFPVISFLVSKPFPLIYITPPTVRYTGTDMLSRSFPCCQRHQCG